ncbi:MAG: hypothetical protein AAF411_22005 [Myxococcota bacterium]
MKACILLDAPAMQRLAFVFVCLLVLPDGAQAHLGRQEHESFTQFMVRVSGFEPERGVELLEEAEGRAWLRAEFGERSLSRRAQSEPFSLDRFLRNTAEAPLAVFRTDEHAILMTPTLGDPCDASTIVIARQSREVLVGERYRTRCTIRFFAPEYGGPLALFLGGGGYSSGMIGADLWMIDLTRARPPLSLSEIEVSHGEVCLGMQRVPLDEQNPRPRFSYDSAGRMQLQNGFRVSVSYLSTSELDGPCTFSESTAVLRTCTWRESSRTFGCDNHVLQARSSMPRPASHGFHGLRLEQLSPERRATYRRNLRFFRQHRRQLRRLGFGHSVRE